MLVVNIRFLLVLDIRFLLVVKFVSYWFRKLMRHDVIAMSFVLNGKLMLVFANIAKIFWIVCFLFNFFWMLEIKFLNVVILHLETLCVLSLQTQERGPDDMLCRDPRSLSYYWLLSLFLLSFIAFCLFPLFLFLSFLQP